MGLFERFRKRWIVKHYLRLGPLLVARYGPDTDYKPGRVRATLEKARISLRYLPHACAMFSTREDFVSWMQARDQERIDAMTVRAGADPYRSVDGSPPPEVGSAEHYRALHERLRAEVADRYNGGSHKFLPDMARDFDQYHPISNDNATGTKALF